MWTHDDYISRYVNPLQVALVQPAFEGKDCVCVCVCLGKWCAVLRVHLYRAAPDAVCVCTNLWQIKRKNQKLCCAVHGICLFRCHGLGHFRTRVVSFRRTPPPSTGLNDSLYGLMRMKMIPTHQILIQSRFWSDVFHQTPSSKQQLKEYLLEVWFSRLASSYTKY